MSKYVHILIVIAFLQAPCSSTDLSNMPPPSDIKELAIDDLKDLLITSIQNTMSLQNLVTQQTQMIVNIMLLVGQTSTKVEELETTLTREMENLKATMNEEVVVLKLKLETLEDSTEVDRHSLEILTESVQVLKTNSSNVKTEVEELETTLTREMENTKANKRSLVTLTESVQALQTTSSNVMILNGEESAGNARCAKVCAGTTGRSSSSYSINSSVSITIDVNISGCGFVKIPTITTSVEGRGAHSTATGTSAVNWATRTGFRMYLSRERASYYATNNKWNVEWIAIGYTC